MSCPWKWVKWSRLDAGNIENIEDIFTISHQNGDNCEYENQEHDNISNGWLAYLQRDAAEENVQKTLITKLMKTRAVPIPLLRFSLVFKFIVASKTEHENNLHLVKTWLCYPGCVTMILWFNSLIAIWNHSFEWNSNGNQLVGRKLAVKLFMTLPMTHGYWICHTFLSIVCMNLWWWW